MMKMYAMSCRSNFLEVFCLKKLLDLCTGKTPARVVTQVISLDRNMVGEHGAKSKATPQGLEQRWYIEEGLPKRV